MNGSRISARWGMALVSVLIVAGCGGGKDETSASSALELPAGKAAGAPVNSDHERSSRGALELVTLSTRPDTVSGGDVLVEVRLPRGVAPADVEVALNGHDVTQAFTPEQTTGRLLGVVSGLKPGRNVLRAGIQGKKGGRGSGGAARLVVENHPITGPVFSGPHQTPFVCQTEASGLGSPIDENCSAPTKVEFLYFSTREDRFLPLPESAPADLASTTTSEGKTVDYVVRLETGTINRAIYQIAYLQRPDETSPTPGDTSHAGWNQRLFYTFGGGCSAGYRQGAPTPAADPSGGVLIPELLSKGYAVASSTLNMFRNDCNDIRSSETMMMVKEHFIESFGVPKFTIGWGCSGGSMQVHLTAQNYPGLLDGIIAGCSYPDIFSLLPLIADCAVIERAFSTSARTWSLAQRSAVTGYSNDGTRQTCSSWAGVPWVKPLPCPGILPPGLVYDPLANPQGVRCSIYDNTVAALGTDPHTGFALRPLDNTGIQYGLTAFNEGAISFDQFAELNELAGGWDHDGNIVPERSSANREALRKAYATGRMLSGENLDEVPIIDLRGYMDSRADIHDRNRSFATRARLIEVNGHADNHVIWVAPAGGPRHPAASFYLPQAVAAMEEWLTAIIEDFTPTSRSTKVVRNKPSDVVDGCWTPTGQRIDEKASPQGTGVCATLYPTFSEPRGAAGGPRAANILKCRLKPVRAEDYAQPLSREELMRLREIFPDGVCDYSRPGVGQKDLKGVWLAYPRPGEAVRLGRADRNRGDD